jgi:methyl-accepting chemotaxis protein
MFKSLKAKILGSMILLTSICTIAFMSVSFFETKSAVTKQMENDGTNLVTIINREISSYDLSETGKIGEALKEIKTLSKENISYISLADTNLKIIASSDGKTSSNSGSTGEGDADAVSSASEENNSAVTDIKEGKSSGYVFKTENGDKVYNVSTPFYKGEKLVGTISIGISLGVMNKMITDSIIEIFIVSLIVLAITIIVGVIISKNITTPITDAIGKLDYFAKGDFTVEFSSKRNDETKKLTDALNQSIFMLKQMLRETKQGMDALGRISMDLKSSSENVEISNKSISEAICEVAQGIEEQDGNVNQVTKSLESFSVALDNIQTKVQNTAASSDTIQNTADVGAERLKELIQSIEDVRSSFGIAVTDIKLLNEDANKIGQIMNVINSVAEQTNLLALNAAIEAARAGEAGRGFSVVADEIRKLAEQVMQSSKSINEIIVGILSSVQGVVSTTQNISGKMDNQINMVDNTMASFKNIQSEVHNTTPQLKNISVALKEVVEEEEVILNSAQEVSAISEQISASTQEITSSVQEQTDTMEQLANLAEKIDEMTNRLNENIGRFKI